MTEKHLNNHLRILTCAFDLDTFDINAAAQKVPEQQAPIFTNRSRPMQRFLNRFMPMQGAAHA